MSASVKVCVVGWGRDGRWIVVDAWRPSVGKVSDGACGCDEEVFLMGGRGRSGIWGTRGGLGSGVKR